MALPAAGLLNSGASLVKAFTSNSTLVQFQDAMQNTLVQFDAVFNEEYTRSSAPTAYPVEDGSSVSDHLQRLPLTITLTAFATDTPFATSASVNSLVGGDLAVNNPLLAEGVTTAASALLPPLGVVAGALVADALFTSRSKNTPSVDLYHKLSALQNGTNTGAQPQSFTVVSRLGRFENMMISNLGVPRDAESGSSALSYQLTLVEVIIVTPQKIPLSAFDVPTLAGAHQAVGQKALKSVDPDSPDAPPSASSGFLEELSNGYNYARIKP